MHLLLHAKNLFGPPLAIRRPQQASPAGIPDPIVGQILELVQLGVVYVIDVADAPGHVAAVVVGGHGEARQQRHEQKRPMFHLSALCVDLDNEREGNVEAF